METQGSLAYNGRVYGKCQHRNQLNKLKIEIMTETKQKDGKAFAIHNVVRSFRKHWRRHGAKYCLFALVSGIWSAKIVGLVMILMLTVPCGIKKVNKNKRLWYLRQLYFAGIGILGLIA